VPVVHGHLPVLGFRFRDTAYVTDVSEIPESSIPLLEGLDTLIIDSLRINPHPTHLSLAQAVGMVERLKPRRAFFTHIAHDLGHEATNSTLPAHVQLAYDGLRLEF
jgi:phosphoribosyl 1,2-cyclic phosphate phosphodiesterase